jgi:hypothetical protein
MDLEDTADLWTKRQHAVCRCGFKFFVAVWHQLSIEGACDALGSAEYARVFREWRAAGRPFNVYGFIKNRANVPPAS